MAKTTMIVFLDFEASSLSKNSFPIEVAWIFEDGRSHTCLIKPAADWLDWASDAEAIHGISRQQLEAEGVPVEGVAATMMQELDGHSIYASAPSWDGKWLSVLLRAAGLPRHALRLQKSDDAFREAVRARSRGNLSEDEITALVNHVISETEATAVPVHRALPDAELELTRWRKVVEATASRVSD